MARGAAAELEALAPARAVQEEGAQAEWELVLTEMAGMEQGGERAEGARGTQETQPLAEAAGFKASLSSATHSSPYKPQTALSVVKE